jgi:hypothetical protein
MMAAERASILSDDKELDISGFKPKPPGKLVDASVPVEQVRAVSEAAQFRSRDPKPLAEKPARRAQRRHRTGRNVQLNIKARAKAVEAFYAIADRQHWVLGETFEHAIEALQRELERGRSSGA